MTQKHTPELDICVSANSDLVHIEEKVSGRNIATMTMKGGTKEERIAMATKFAAALELLEALIRCEYAMEHGTGEEQEYAAKQARAALAKATSK